MTRTNLLDAFEAAVRTVPNDADLARLWRVLFDAANDNPIDPVATSHMRDIVARELDRREKEAAR